MTKEIWINLPVKDVAASVNFFTAIGFRFNTQQQTPTSACMLVGQKNVVVMLFEQQQFESFVQLPATDAFKSSEVLFSIDAESREEVDAWPQKVTAAGGKVFSPPAAIQGWMYGCAFADLDGHRWNVLYMDAG